MTLDLYFILAIALFICIVLIMRSTKFYRTRSFHFHKLVAGAQSPHGNGKLPWDTLRALFGIAHHVTTLAFD